MPLTLALDIGTSGMRAAMFASDGIKFEITGSSDNSGPLPPLRTGGSTGDFESPRREIDVNEAVAGVLRLIGSALDRIDVPLDILIPGAAMHTLVLLDERLRPLAGLSGWTDSPPSERFERWRKIHSDRGWYRLTGCPFSPVYPLYRLLQLREDNREIFGRIRLALSFKSYLLLQLTGLAVEDYSTAGASGLFNIGKREWEGEILKMLGVQPHQLPRPVSSLLPLRIAGVDPSKSEGMFRPPDELIPLIQSYEKRVRLLLPGSSDGALAHLGSAGLDAGRASLTIGSSGAVRLICATPVFDRQERSWCYPFDDRHYIRGIATNNGGNVLRKFAFDHECETHLNSVEGLDRLVTEAPFESDLYYSPYLFPERSEFLERLIRPERAGRFSRSVEGEPPGGMMRAVLEALAFHLTFLFLQLDERREAREIILSGGLTLSRFIQSLLAELLPCPVRRLSEDNSSLVGAWRMASSLAADRVSHHRQDDEPDRDVSFGEAVSARKTDAIRDNLPLPRGVYQKKYAAWLQFVFHPAFID